MVPETVVILGIPVDNLTTDEAIERIFSMIEAYHGDGRPRQVATVNVDFVVNTLAWRLGRSRHPELLDILRRADLVTADGMPLVVISKLLGSPLKERVAGADLVPSLAEVAARSGKSIYFLGGREGVGKRAAFVLQEKYPNLLISGIDSPFVHIEGESLGEAEEKDRLIIEHINNARPDILLIAFGNPKQEIWFNRNRNRLHVPVSIGIGGTFEFIAGYVQRAPAWMQKSGLEWIFRITQDPGRLWKRYLVGFFKFSLMVWPAVLYYRYERLRYRMFRLKGALSPQTTHHDLAPALGSGYLTVVTLPRRLDLVALEGISEEVDREFAGSSKGVLDFGQVSFIDSTGLGFLIRTLNRVEREGGDIYFVRVTPEARRVFEFNRTWDLFKEKTYDQIGEVFTKLGEERRLPPFYTIMTHGPEVTRLDLFGRLDAQQMSGMDMAALTSAISGRDCILHLGHLNFVDSSGLSFFFKIQKVLVNSGKRCVLCDLTDNVKQVFRLTKLNQLFRLAPDLPAAERMMTEIT